MAFATPLCNHEQSLEQTISALFAEGHPRVTAPTPAPKSRERVKLWDLPPNFHCSVVGTCLDRASLRNLVARANPALADASDLVLHEEAVVMARRRDTGRALQKALDRRHEEMIARFARVVDADGLLAAWNEHVASGDVPGAYWAVLTHPASPPALVQRTFGDVHMLSHLAGAENRADLRRMARLEQTCAESRARIGELEERVALEVESRELACRRLEEVEKERAVRLAREEAVGAKDVAALRDELDASKRRLELEAERCMRAERRCGELMERVARLESELTLREVNLGELRQEVIALEGVIADFDTPRECDSRIPSLDGWTVLYVGGRPAQTHYARSFVENLAGRFIHHDGGVEDRRGLLVGVVARADVVFFPVDCISHDAALSLKRACGQLGKPFVALRSTGFGAFAAALEPIVARACPATELSSDRVAG